MHTILILELLQLTFQTKTGHFGELFLDFLADSTDQITKIIRSSRIQVCCTQRVGARAVSKQRSFKPAIFCLGIESNRQLSQIRTKTTIGPSLLKRITKSRLEKILTSVESFAKFLLTSDWTAHSFSWRLFFSFSSSRNWNTECTRSKYRTYNVSSLKQFLSLVCTDWLGGNLLVQRNILSAQTL